MEVRMNVVGNLGDPQKLASALEPLVACAEDKALAELHAVLAVVVSALHQEIAGLRQDLTTVAREGVARFASVADDAVGRMEKTISTMGVATRSLLQDSYHEPVQA